MILAERPGIVQYRPHGGASRLFTAESREVLLDGPAGTGKTYACLWRLHTLAMQHPGIRALMVRKTLSSLTGSALVTYQEQILGSGVYGVVAYGGSKFSPAEFRYPNGSRIIVGGMDKASKVMSAEYDVAYVNEATELTETDWQAITTRLRHGAMPFQQLIADCNPSGPQHWLNVRCNAGRTTRIKSTHRDNPMLWRDGGWTPFGRTYMDKLEALTGVARKRLLDGIWAATEGIVYPEFTYERHVKSVDTEGWRCVLGVDVGARNPTAILTAYVSGDERIHIGHEVYRGGMTSTDILDAIAAEADRARPDTIYIDPSAKMLIDDLKRKRYPVQKATNDVIGGINRVRTALTEGFTIDPACSATIDEFGMYAYPENARIETDNPVKEHDHCLVAGTMVETDAGPVPIERVNVGDRVLTREGYRPVVAAGISALHAKVMTVHLSNGATLTGTGNHRVWDATRGDWMRIDTLRYGDIMEGIQENPSCASKSSSTRASRSADTLIQSDGLTGRTSRRAVTIASVALVACMRKSGRITTGPFLPAMKSIMQTAITSTTILKTLSVFLQTSTARTTRQSVGRSILAACSGLRRIDQRPLSGTSQKKGVRGIAPTLEISGPIANPSRGPVSSAEHRTSHGLCSDMTGFVPTSAGRQVVARPALTTRTDRVLSVEPHSASTSTAPARRAPVYVVGVSKVAQRQTVYDLTVAGAHEFYANGILVHNSMDALRYLVAGVLAVKRKPGKIVGI